MDDIEFTMGGTVGLSVGLSVPGSGDLPDVDVDGDGDEHPVTVEDR